jgi:branched-subunit amino acid transport protein
VYDEPLRQSLYGIFYSLSAIVYCTMVFRTIFGLVFIGYEVMQNREFAKWVKRHMSIVPGFMLFAIIDTSALTVMSGGFMGAKAFNAPMRPGTTLWINR